MKRLVFVIGLISINLFGSGRVALENQVYWESKQSEPTLSLAVYEHITLGVNYDMWTGVSHKADGGDFSVISKHELEKYFGDLKVFVGVTYRHKRLMDSDIHGGVSYKLW